ncbi:SWIM zinc finger family protein [Kamptonema cortianum]|nr:SWIM zinc finger family protein [Geitlerinema splendidum]MDK3155044.1 SWIM zinc finger family protein [Kamptonema cortianum]
MYLLRNERKKQLKKVAALIKKGHVVNPIVIEGRVIAKTFWGKAWCKHLETYSDYENRLPRGRTYVRNGSVIDLKLSSGEIKALVSGSSIYTVTIKIDPVAMQKWKGLIEECAGKIDSVIELLQGKFSKGVMEIITHQEKGLFPDLENIKMDCSCYDYADMCKHVAAVLYGVGVHLDDYPEDLFLLRKVNHTELIAITGLSDLSKEDSNQDTAQFTGDLSSLFNIEIEGESPPVIYLDSKVKKHPQEKRAGLNSKKPLQKEPKPLKNRHVKKTKKF